ncbi:VRR-NUC domain-containing protein [Janthinobacterium sp. TB1-E2]|uniref:VRR-NUC domain-containing protein n=1 Tax=Janthinobacterium aestuarii TaxID=2985511 RepID=A0ABZ2GSA5_9BURK
MSGPYPTGEMSLNGTTTPVHINFAEVNGKDKDVLCMAVCECKAVPEIGKKGQSLRQVCVSKMMSKRDALAGYQSEHKAEVNYDMTKYPPVPIMDFNTKTMAHRWAPGWIKKNWDADPTHPLWLPGEGYVRRPDVVIVKDPTKPPTHDNIKQVVEIKFDGDPWGSLQAESYEIISGEDKLALLTPTMCSCDDPDRKKRTEDLKAEELKDELKGMLDIIANKGGRGGRRPRLPKKLPNLKD